MVHSILMHEPDDDVGVAVVDIKAGAEVGAVTLEGQHVGAVKMVQDVLLGHKVAMRDIAGGKDVIEYGRVIGIASGVGAARFVRTRTSETKR
jgi:(2R)-sulfolactate sulfo-lyase subunit alpha